MSNYARVQATPRPDDRWKGECRRGLDSCYRSCTASLREMGSLRSGMKNLDRALESLRQADFAELRATARELDAAAVRVRELERQLVRLGEESAELEREGRARTRDAAQRAGELDRELAADRSRLDALSQDVAAAVREAEAIGRQLEGAFRRASEAEAALEQTAAEGRRIGADLERAWADRGMVQQQLQEAGELWAGIRDELTQRSRRCGERLAETSLLLDALRGSESAAFAVWRSLREQTYEVVHYQSQQAGIEVFLRDQNDRLVAFQLRREEETGEDLLLELDLSGFDREGESAECDQQLEFLLEELDEVIAIRRTDLEHPHRRRPASSAQRIVTPSGRRRASLTPQARKQRTT